MPTSTPKISELTLREKIAQLFVMGFRGGKCKAGSEIHNMITEDKPGGVILFDKDMVSNKPVKNIESPKQVRELTNQLQQASKIPLFIGIDQEGGVINRLKPEYGFPKTRSHLHLSQIDNVPATQEEGELISRTLAESGINLNFAPCLDLSLNPESSIISKKERSFGYTPEKVIKHAKAYIEGHQVNEILTCCKHFPGHGSAAGDTHSGFVDVSKSWIDEEIEPYKYLIKNNLCPIIMTSHIFNKNFDKQYPATLSKKVITNLLRDDLGFNGLVVTDDMQMRAISDYYGLKQSLMLGINAGIDLFCFGNNLLEETVELSKAITAVEELIENGDVSNERIDESVQRILATKKTWLA